MRLADFTFSPDCPPTVLEQAQDFLQSRYGEFKKRASFAVFSSKGEKAEFVNNNCHASITGTGLLNRACIANENAMHRRWQGQPPEGVYDFFSWFAVDSPFSAFILNRDSIHFMARYGFVISADIPCGLFQNMNIICRHFWEASEVSFKVFKQIIDAGYPAEIAYSIAFNTNISKCDNTTPDMGNIPQYVNTEQIFGYSQHRAWVLWYSLDSMQKFLRWDLGKTFKKEVDTKFFYRNHATTIGGASYCDNIYRSRPSDFIAEFIINSESCRQRLRDFRGETTGEIIANPFAKKVTGMPNKVPDKVNMNELMAVILPSMKEEGLFNVQG